MQKMELSYWWEQGDEKNKNKLGEWRALADTVGIKSEHMAVCDLPYNWAVSKAAKLLNN